MNPHIIRVPPASCYYMLIRLKYSLHYPILNILSLCTSLSIRDEEPQLFNLRDNIIGCTDYNGLNTRRG